MSAAPSSSATSCRAFRAAEEAGTFPAELWKPLGRNGFLGIGYPEALGGSGTPDALAIAILSEELARASGGIAVTPLVSAYMAAPHLARYGTPEQQERYLRPIIAGDAVRHRRHRALVPGPTSRAPPPWPAATRTAIACTATSSSSPTAASPTP
ncbi:MAG: acyl-CoA dehydrogenase family protein [Chloroflexia bacterium]